MQIKSSQIIYSEHHYDECFEHTDGTGRVSEGTAIGYESGSAPADNKFILFSDIKYSDYDHDYWDNLELENDTNRLILP